MKSSEYIESERKAYAYYIIENRALPCISDGLKTPGRRLLWTARGCDKWKTAALAGQTMKLHPHSEASGVLNTLTSEYMNNHPVFNGLSGFGTKLDMHSFGAARYTSLEISEFTKDVLFCDIDLIPMEPNYDLTSEEPSHFLPLVPFSLLNSVDGIAIGFACNILPRRLGDVVDAQIKILQGKKIKNNLVPYFNAFDCEGVHIDGNRWRFDGEIAVDGKKVKITKVPHGVSHEKLINDLYKLADEGFVVDIIDESRAEFDIEVKLRDIFEGDNVKLMAKLGVVKFQNENINVMDFTRSKILTISAEELITQFTNWRLKYFKQRYNRLMKIANERKSYVEDVIILTKSDVSKLLKKGTTTTNFKGALKDLGIQNIDKIASISINKLINASATKYEAELVSLNTEIENYEVIVGSVDEQKKQYIKELKEINKKYNK